MELRISGPPLRCSIDHDLVLGTSWRSYKEWPGEGQRRGPVIAERIAIEGEDTDTPLDPWVYGYWRVQGIEDTLPVPSELAAEAIAMLDARGLRVRSASEDRGTAYLYVNGLLEGLQRIDAFSTPGITLAYRRASIEVRRELMAGALDAKAYFKRGLPLHVTIQTSNATLVNDLAEVATSLGWRSSAVHAKNARFMRVHKAYPVMHLREMELAEARGAMKRKSGKGLPPYYVHEWIEIDPAEYVDLRTEAGTYMAGRGMVPVRDW